MFGMASAISIVTPVNNFHYNTSNIPFEIYSLDGDSCNLTYMDMPNGFHSDNIMETYNFGNNSTTSFYSDNIITGKNIVDVTCNISGNQSLTFFNDDTTPVSLIWIPILIFAILTIFTIIVFKINS